MALGTQSWVFGAIDTLFPSAQLKPGKAAGMVGAALLVLLVVLVVLVLSSRRCIESESTWFLVVREIAGRPCVNGSWCCRMRVAPRPDVEEVDRGFGAQTAQRSNPRYHYETPTVSLPRWSSCVSKSLPLSAGWGPIQPRNRTAGQVRDSGHACFSAFCLFLTTRKIVKTAINKCTGRWGKRETTPHAGQYAGQSLGSRSSGAHAKTNSTV